MLTVKTKTSLEGLDKYAKFLKQILHPANLFENKCIDICPLTPYLDELILILSLIIMLIDSQNAPAVDFHSHSVITLLQNSVA